MSLSNSVGFFFKQKISHKKKENENIGIMSNENDSAFSKLLKSSRVRSILWSERGPVEFKALFQTCGIADTKL